MAATVGELVVNLTARTAAFDRGMERSGRKASVFGNKIRSLAPMMASFGTAFLGFIAARRLAEWFREGIQGIDRMAKVSRKLGTTVEQLNALHFAGMKAGIGVNTIDMALQRMTRRVAEAAIGTGEAKAAIAELGLAPSKLSAAGPYGALLKIGDALKQIESPAQRVRLAFKMFDSEGVDMVNIFENGSEAIKKAKERMDALGGSTSLGAKNVEALTNKMADLGAIFSQGGRNRMIEAMAGLGAHAGLFGERITGESIARRLQAEANAREKASTFEQARARQNIFEKAAQSGQGLIDKMGQSFVLRGMDEGQKRIALWLKEARSVGMAREELREYAVAMAKLYQQQKTYDMGIEVAGLKKRAQQARSTAIQSLIAQQLGDRGGGGLQLPGAYGAGSAQAYSATVRAGMQPLRKKTDEDILKATLEQLEVERKMEHRLEKIAQQLDDVEIGVTNLR